MSTSGLGNTATRQSADEAADERQALNEAAIEEMRITCPAVQFSVDVRHHPPPSTPRTRGAGEPVGMFQPQTRNILEMGPMTTVHLEQPVAPLELDIDMRPIFGSRSDAMAWIESDAGQRFSEGAKALSLICFMVVSAC